MATAKKKTEKKDPFAHLMLHRTTKAEIAAGITSFVKSDGVRLTDTEGKVYLDLVSGVTRPVHIGYGRKEVAQAVYDQIMKVPYFTPMQYTTPPASELADLLAGVAPKGIEKFIFVCDGSEAVETALKIAKHYHHFKGERVRHKIISRRGAYHGITGGALRALGTVLPMRQVMEPLGPGVAFIESPYCYRCPIGHTYPGCDLQCAKDLARVIEFEDPTQVSAFIGEPIQQGFGAYKPVKEYWTEVRNICDKYGVLMIVDEVICGFGRTGKWFGIQNFDVSPDIMTMAKGLSSGYVPLGGVGCSAKVADPIDVLYMLHTYGNHPVSCAAGIANFEILQGEKLIENSAKVGAYMLEGLKALEKKHPTVGEARGTGLWLALDMTTDKKTHAPYPAARLGSMVARAKEKGLIIKAMGMALEFAPPLVVTKADIDEGMKTIEAVITAEEKDMGYK